MALSSIGVRTSNLTITQASAQIYTTAAVACNILEISLMQLTSTAQSLGFGRPQALAVTPGTLATLQRDNTGFPVCVTQVSLTYGTSPTAPLVFNRRWNSAATIGVGMVWTFPRGFMIPVSAGAVLWNITTALAVDLNFSADE